MPARAVLWDVGGTLVDFSSPRGQSFRRTLAYCGIDPADLSPATVEKARAAFAADEPTWRTGDDERAGWRRHAAMLLDGYAGATPALIDQLGRRLSRYGDAYSPVPGIPQLLDDLAARGLVQGVVSNWSPSLRQFLDDLDLSRHFAAVVCSADEGVLKPDPRLFARALERLGVTAEQAIFIGNDPLLDIAPARALGMRTVHFDPRREWPAQADAHDVPRLRRVLLPML